MEIAARHSRGEDMMTILRLRTAMVAFSALAYLHALGAEPLELRIDFARTNGTWRALHGINRGPLVAGGMIDVIESQRALNIPSTRLHDSHWPNSDVVDIHAVFPDFARDPAPVVAEGQVPEQTQRREQRAQHLAHEGQRHFEVDHGHGSARASERHARA